MRPAAISRSAEAVAEITDLAHDGRGVARVDGKVVFIIGALPGERVRYRLRHRRRAADSAERVAIERVSPDRVTPRCIHFDACGGCSLQHLSAERQIAFKQKQLLDALQRIGHVQPETVAAPVTGPLWGYRRRARLGVKDVPKKGGVLVGFREKETPLIAPLTRCEVLDERIGAKLQALAECIAQLSVRRFIPQVEVAAADHVALVFRVLQPPTAADRERLLAFGREHDFEIYLQTGGPGTVAPLAPPARELAYSPDGSDLRLAFEPTDFVQVNAALNRAMIGQALDWLALKPGERVLELFSGLGNFSLPLARAGARVTAVEGEAGLVERARDNVRRNGLDIRTVQTDLFQPPASADWLSDAYDAVLLDPPRAGAREILPVVTQHRPARLLYVSCHPATLARDASYLVHERGYRLTRTGVLDMFPHTIHVESMALFVRGPTMPS
jgi:23S rRNA (uracil1939-C5)-methyltransferase